MEYVGWVGGYALRYKIMAQGAGFNDDVYEDSVHDTLEEAEERAKYMESNCRVKFAIVEPSYEWDNRVRHDMKRGCYADYEGYEGYEGYANYPDFPD